MAQDNSQALHDASPSVATFAALPSRVKDSIIWHCSYPALVSLARCSKDVSALATEALYDTIVLNNEDVAERFISTSQAAVDRCKHIHAFNRC